MPFLSASQSTKLGTTIRVYCFGAALITTALLIPGDRAHGQSAPPRLDAAVADSFARAARARPLPSFSTLRVTTPPTIDGKLDEAMWSQGTPIRDFVQRELNEGVPASERTEVRLATDGVNLYIGARMYDRRDPARQPKSDFLLGQDIVRGGVK